MIDGVVVRIRIHPQDHRRIEIMLQCEESRLGTEPLVSVMRHEQVYWDQYDGDLIDRAIDEIKMEFKHYLLDKVEEARVARRKSVRSQSADTVAKGTPSEV